MKQHYRSSDADLELGRISCLIFCAVLYPVHGCKDASYDDESIYLAFSDGNQVHGGCS